MGERFAGWMLYIGDPIDGGTLWGPYYDIDKAQRDAECLSEGRNWSILPFHSLEEEPDKEGR